jgi:hypothetical protein
MSTCIGIGIGIPFRRMGAGTSFQGLLDLYPNAAAAYSLRKLRADYSGAAVRIRRSSDNAETDIGFLNNEFDSAAAQTFCGAGNGFVTTWYDQSLNGNNAAQTTASRQPEIVSSGVILTENGKPKINFNNANIQFLLLNTSLWTYTGDSTVFHVSVNKNTDSSFYGPIIAKYGSLQNGLGVMWNVFPSSATNAATDVYAPGGIKTDNTQNVNTQYLAAFKWENWSTHKTNGNTIIAVNGSNQALSAYGSTPTGLSGSTRIGTFDQLSSGSFLGDMQEIVVYENAFNQTDIDGAENNINLYYGIY